MHKIENKSLWKEEMNYGVVTWYMGRTFEKLGKKKKKKRLHLANIYMQNLLHPLMNFSNKAPN